jgi:hypothetical protein
MSEHHCFFREPSGGRPEHAPKSVVAAPPKVVTPACGALQFAALPVETLRLTTQALHLIE